MSVSSSVYDYKYEHGRRYHALSEGKYVVPNDEPEMDRLDLQHHTFRLTVDGALYVAPIPKDVQNVLDVGTGTGIWAIEFAEQHPNSTVLGIDLSPIQSDIVPPNCSFLIDDADHDWIFRSPFDFIHSRAMLAGFKNWPRFFQQSFTNLNPGGYLEVQEFHMPPVCESNATLNENPSPNPIIAWGQIITGAASQIGLDFTAAASFGPALQAAGFVDVHVKRTKWPFGQWAKGEKLKELGKYAQQDLKDGLGSSTLALCTRVLGWSREEVEVFCAGVKKELREGVEGVWLPVSFWYARKPHPDEVVGEQTITAEEISLEIDEEYLALRRKKLEDVEQSSANSTASEKSLGKEEALKGEALEEAEPKEY